MADSPAANWRIGHISVQVDDVFDTRDPHEDGASYRLANALHLTTREQTIRQQLLFHEGDAFDTGILDETARLLRGRRYLYEASVQPANCNTDTGIVNVLVRVHDVWSLSPGVSFGRKGGRNSSTLEFEDQNFLGRGKRLSLGRTQTVDRAGGYFAYGDPNVWGSRWQAHAAYGNNSDGSSREVFLERPFYSLDTRWNLGFSASQLKQTTTRYALGKSVDSYDEDGARYDIYGGISGGRRHGATRRWLAGLTIDNSRFAPPATGAMLAPAPEDRRLLYPWIGIEIIEDDFDTTRNQNQLQRTEDLNFGYQLRAQLGLATQTFNSDRSAALFDLRAGTGFRLKPETDSLFVETRASGRMESGTLRDGSLSGNASYYHRHDPNSFSIDRLLFAGLTVSRRINPDLDHPLLLGGDSGLRGYPLRFQGGDASVLATLEQRFFTQWYPLHLVRVGACLFADAGRTFGTDTFGNKSAGWLYDAGFGLRLGNSRSSLGNVIHLDVAFPLSSIDGHHGPQFLVQTKTSF